MFVLFLGVSGLYASNSEKNAESVDVKEIVLGHMGDDYSWHISTWRGHHISIPLPVILRSETTGWHVFSSARFHDSETGVYQGFFRIRRKTGKSMSATLREMKSDRGISP